MGLGRESKKAWQIREPALGYVISGPLGEWQSVCSAHRLIVFFVAMTTLSALFSIQQIDIGGTALLNHWLELGCLDLLR